MNRFFCSLLSQENREQIYGTAPLIAKWFLLEYPAAWRTRAIEKSNIPDRVKDHFSEYAAAVPNSRQILIRQNHKLRDGCLRCFVVNCREKGSGASRLELASFDELADSNLAMLENRADARLLDEPLFLVCTHGTHDKCCAKFGLPVYRALRHEAGEQAWQCSHIGGDRFAANVICFPHGIYYGHVTPEDVGPILDTYRRGEIYLKNYRGRCCYPRVAQIAEYFIRSESGALKIDELQFLGSGQTEAGTWRARFRGRGGNIHDVEFRIRERQFYAYRTCGSETPKPISRYELCNYSVNGPQA